MEALIPAPAYCEVQYMITFLNAQKKAPIEMHRHLFQAYVHNTARLQHITCMSAAGRVLIIIQPIAQ